MRALDGCDDHLQIGVHFPELTSALVLEDPPWWLSRPAQASHPGQRVESPMAKWAKDLPNHTLEELLVQYRQDHHNWSEETVRLMCESKKQLDPMIIVDMIVDRMLSQEVDWLTTIQNMAHPMLLFTANPELGGIVTPEVAAKVRELNPKVAIVNIPDVGHLIRFDNYTDFMAALHAFLTQVLS